MVRERVIFLQYDDEKQKWRAIPNEERRKRWVNEIEASERLRFWTFWISWASRLPDIDRDQGDEQMTGLPCIFSAYKDIKIPTPAIGSIRSDGHNI